MGWEIPVDIYCERTGAGFWSEPVNALTNAAFLLAALGAAIRYRQAGVRDAFLAGLICVVILIGTGSFAFHTLATRGAALLDVIPITVFVYSYLYLALRRYLGLRPVLALFILSVFIASSTALSVLTPRGWLNGSADYLPPLAALFVVGFLAPRAPLRRGILAAAAIFTLSLIFRTIDQTVCSAFAVGTHFVWHILNAAVLYTLLATAVDDGKSSAVHSRR